MLDEVLSGLALAGTATFLAFAGIFYLLERWHLDSARRHGQAGEVHRKTIEQVKAFTFRRFKWSFVIVSLLIVIAWSGRQLFLFA